MKELALAALVVSATGGCDSLVGISDVPPVTDATADTAAPIEAGGGPDVVDAPSDVDASMPVDAPLSCGDTQSSAVNCGSCGHACAGAQACVTGVCQPLVALLPVGSGASPFALAQDDSYLYWTDHEFNGIMRTDKVLGGSSMVAGAGRSPTALLASDGGLYWGNEDNVSACNLSGCLGSASALASTADSGVVSVAVDTDWIYWSEGNPALLRASKIWDGGLRIGDTFWQGDASVGHVATDGQRVYFTANDGLLRVVDVDGGNEIDLGSPGAAGSFDLVVDDASAYWSVRDPAQGVIDRSPLSAPSATTLASGQRFPASIASDGTNLYWIAGTSKANETAIMGCTIASCTPKVVTTIAAATLSAIVVDGLADLRRAARREQRRGIWKIAK